MGDHSKTISLEELQVALVNGRTQSYLKAIGLDHRDAIKLWQIMAFTANVQEVDMDEFAKAYMRMKGSASGIDLQILMYETVMIKQQAREFHQRATEKFDKLQRRVNDCVRSQS